MKNKKIERSNIPRKRSQANRISPHDGDYIFKHPLTQEVAYNSLLLKRRSQLHGKIALCIETDHKNELEKFYGLLAYHYSNSTDKKKALYYLCKAGEQAEKMYAGKEAMDYYTQALSLLDDNLSETSLESLLWKNIELKINLLSNRGTVHRQFFGNYKEALKDYERALKLSKIIKNKYCEAMSLSNIGSVFRRQGKYEKTLSYYEKAMNILTTGRHSNKTSKKDYKIIASLFNKIGVVYDDMGNSETAISFYQKALNASKKIKDKHIMAATLGNIGIIYDNRGNYEQALKYYNEALCIETEQKNKRGIAGNFENIGIAYNLMGNYQTALSYFEKAFKVFDEISDKSEIAFCLTNIGNAYYKLEQYTKALEYQKHALEIKQELGEKWGIANSLDEIGMIYQKLGNLKLALNHHNLALNIAKEIGAKAIEANILINIGIIKSLQIQNKTSLQRNKDGTSNRNSDAKKFIESGIRIAKQIGNQEVIEYGNNALKKLCA
ncbi:MAG: tetratricopeptide repeat protein [bacterium]|nr:tetratricopeptide repeat protein [bacterium]